MLMERLRPEPPLPLPLERVRTRALTAVSTPRPLQKSSSVLQNFSGCQHRHTQTHTHSQRHIRTQPYQQNSWRGTTTTQVR